MSLTIQRLPANPMSRYECPQCDSPVGQHHVFSKFDFQESPPQMQTAIYCPHCDVFHERRFILNSGSWMPIGEPRAITAPKRLQSLRKKVNEVGRIQLAQSA